MEVTQCKPTHQLTMFDKQVQVRTRWHLKLFELNALWRGLKWEVGCTSVCWLMKFDVFILIYGFMRHGIEVYYLI